MSGVFTLVTTPVSGTTNQFEIYYTSDVPFNGFYLWVNNNPNNNIYIKIIEQFDFLKLNKKKSVNFMNLIFLNWFS